MVTVVSRDAVPRSGKSSGMGNRSHPDRHGGLAQGQALEQAMLVLVYWVVILNWTKGSLAPLVRYSFVVGNLNFLKGYRIGRYPFLIHANLSELA